MKKILIVLIILINLGSVTAFAENDTETTAEIPPALLELKESLKNDLSETALSKCQENLVPIFDIEIIEFLTFLDDTFKNKSSTSSLVNLAIARFDLFKSALDDAFGRLAIISADAEGTKEYTTEFDSYDYCEGIKEFYVELGEEHLIRHIKNNVTQKRSTILLEKFKAINEKLRKLNDEIAEMYAYFLTFKNKLPAFVNKCL